ncbi:hypothetical protein OS493_022839 [Desmophyllum pertusum]|uniref:Uncharacterized protein n=1 Tax=Desmophyllum pertusum TaxID=174260 RepID=A0A9W9ZM28_9CNID|nr:hypothetical protein OS493_022839 [Desmophyllum pertusum]
MFGYGIEVISILIVINRCLLHRHTEINILHLGGQQVEQGFTRYGGGQPPFPRMHHDPFSSTVGLACGSSAI